MAWEWSHSVEAYEAVRLNIGDLSRDDLREIYAEWRANDGHDDNSFDEEIHSATLQAIADNKTSSRALAGTIYNFARDQATCNNGGFEAWVCPFGCHTVRFDRDSEVDR